MTKYPKYWQNVIIQGLSHFDKIDNIGILAQNMFDFETKA